MRHDLQYYMIDFNEPSRTPELFRSTAHGEGLNTIKAMASQWNWYLYHMGESRPSGQQMNAMLKYPLTFE